MQGPCLLLAALLLAASATPTSADSWNLFGAPKSVNLQNSPAIKSYATSTGGELNLEDAHAVVGAPIESGGYVLGGKAMECADECTGGQSASKTEGFAIKTNAAGEQVWGWRSDLPGVNDAINSVVELPSGEILIAGWRTIGSVAHRALTKLSSNGEEVWTSTAWGDSPGSNGAFELVTLVNSTDLLLSGLIQKPDTEEMAFKSYGNAPGGTAWFAKIAISVVSLGRAPSSADITWDKVEADYMSCKAAMVLPDGSIAALFWGEELSAGLGRYTSTGSKIWGPENYGATQRIEGTDIAVSADGKQIGISGHGAYVDSSVGLTGKLVIVNAEDGSFETKTEVTAKGSAELIYNECWGVIALPDGFVVACGTGIEGCSDVSSQFRAQCEAGIGDPSTPNIRFGAGQWLAMAAKISTKGDLVWQLAAAFRSRDTDACNQCTSFTADSSSAAEWVMQNADGTIGFVNDETDGFGVMVLGTEGDVEGHSGMENHVTLPAEFTQSIPAALLGVLLLIGALVATALFYHRVGGMPSESHSTSDGVHAL